MMELLADITRITINDNIIGIGKKSINDAISTTLNNAVFATKITSGGGNLNVSYYEMPIVGGVAHDVTVASGSATIKVSNLEAFKFLGKGSISGTVGSVEMKQIFKFNQKIDGYYKNNMGLAFEIASFATEIEITENSILIFYEHYLENNWQSSNKLKILF